MDEKHASMNQAMDYLYENVTMPIRASIPRDIEGENFRMKIAEENINTLAVMAEKSGPGERYISQDHTIEIQFFEKKAPIFFQNGEEITYVGESFMKLKQLLDTIGRPESSHPLAESDFVFHPSSRKPDEVFTYFLSNNNWDNSTSIFSNLHSEKRSFFTFSEVYYGKKCLGEHCAIPHQKKYPLFSRKVGLSPSHVCFLSDDLDIIQRNYIKNQYKMGRDKSYQFVSFFAPGNDLSRVDWEPLRRKGIYYLLKLHSGMSLKEMFQKAHDILDILFPKDPEKRIVDGFYFVSFEALTNVCNGTTDKDFLPFYMTVEAFQRKYSSITESADFPPPPIMIKDLYSALTMPIAEKKQAIIPELIPAQTVTLFYGCQNAMLTKFMVSMAFSVSQGKSFVASWPHTAPPQKCLYIHNHVANLNFNECLIDALVCNFPKLQGTAEENIQKIVTGDYPKAPFLKNDIISFSNNFVGFPPLDPSDPISWQNFSWMSLQTDPFENDFIDWIALVRPVVSNTPSIKVIVLDIPDILQNAFVEPMFLDKFRRFLNESRCRGCSVFLTGLPAWGDRKEVLNLEIDQIFRFDRKMDYSSGAVFDVHVERNDVSAVKCLPVKNCFSYGASTAGGPKRWTLETKKISTDDKIKILKHYKNRPILEIALLTGWSIPLIKKLRRTGKLAKPVPSRSPKNREKNPYAPYL